MHGQRSVQRDELTGFGFDYGPRELVHCLGDGVCRLEHQL
jgi:hypothetical protein